jgi:hypothetical protein
VFIAAGSVAVAALTAGITTVVHAAPAAPPQPAASAPLSAVTSALTRTSAVSYAFSIDTTVRLPKKELNSDLVSGAYDPAQRRGTELLIASAAGQTTRAQIRFIGASLYTSVTRGSTFARPWDKTPLAAAPVQLPPSDPHGFVSDQAVSPSVLMSVLRSEGAAIRDSGPVSGLDWTGTRYTFTVRPYGGLDSFSGTVDVDGQGRVRRLVWTTTEKGRNAPASTVITTARDITFSDFGAPVRVTAPPASQVKSTTGKPYWGFYF